MVCMLKQTNKREPKIIFVHNSLMGGSARIAASFNLPSASVLNYYDDGETSIILTSRPAYITESLAFQTTFINKYYQRIIGVIIVDDKNRGSEFASEIEHFQSLGIPIIAVLDRILTLEEKVLIERWISKHAK